MKNILVAIDFSAHAEKLIRHTEEIAAKFDSRVWIVHVAEPEPDFVGYEPGPQYMRDDTAEHLKEKHQLLRQMAAELQQKNIKAESLLIQGSTVDTILKETEKLGIDLIVIGANEHGFLHHLWFGDTTAEVIKNTSVPLLVVPLR